MDHSTRARLSEAAPYVVPFAVFAALTIGGPLLGLPPWLTYPLKTVLAAAALIYYSRAYLHEIKPAFNIESVLAGILVFGLWILLDGAYGYIGTSHFNPYEQASGGWVYALIAFRLGGSALVVPVMEELFWRSFALRFVMSPDFRSVPLGKFSWYSFILVSVLFGLEHHEWLSGILAGMVYAALLYRTRNLFDPILAHAVTNLLLGVYVLTTGSWSFW